MTATLRLRPAPDLGAGGVRLVLDCRHGTTYADLIDLTPRVLTDRALVRIAMARHDFEERCGCIRGLDTLARSRRGARA